MLNKQWVELDGWLLSCPYGCLLFISHDTRAYIGAARGSPQRLVTEGFPALYLPPLGSLRIPESSICTRLFAYVENGAGPSVLTAENPPRGKYGPRGDMASSIEPGAPPIGSFEQMYAVCSKDSDDSVEYAYDAQDTSGVSDRGGRAKLETRRAATPGGKGPPWVAVHSRSRSRGHQHSQ